MRLIIKKLLLIPALLGLSSIVSAQVVVTGKLVRADGHTWLEASGLPRYQLTGVTKDIEVTLNARRSGEVVLEGEAPETDSATHALFVKSVTD